MRLMLGLMIWAAAGAAHADDLTLRFDGLKPQGALMIAVFDSEAAWKARRRAVRDMAHPVRAGAEEVRLALPAGAYGVMVFHDLNGDRRMNFSAVGLPREPYGFSNGARGTLGPPAWKAAAFRLEGRAVQTLRLK